MSVCATSGRRELAWVTRDGQKTPAVRVPGAGRFFSLDATGKRVLRMNAVGQRDLWMEDLEKGTSTRLMSGDGWFTGTWSPDGEWAVYPKGLPMPNLYRVRTRAGSPEERLTTSGHTQVPTSISPDGTMLVYDEANPTTSSDIWMMRLPLPGGGSATPPEARPLVNTKATESLARISADGRWLAYQSNESGRFEVYIRAFPEGDQTIQVSNSGGLAPVWSRKGTNLYYRSISGSVMLATVTSAPAPALTTPRPLFDARGYENVFDVSPDDERFLMMPVVTTEVGGGQIHVILNFLEELRQRVR